MRLKFKFRQVERVITGVEYNEIDRQLLAVINNNTNDLQALQYRSDLDQLKDSSASEIARRNSKQRLVAFLRKAAHKAGDVAQKVATEALTKYLESLIKSGG